MKTMLLTTQKILIVAALLVFGSTAAAQSPSQRGYNLFNPVPVETDLNLDLVAAHRIGHVRLHGVIGELPLVPRVAVMLEDELLVKRC